MFRCPYCGSNVFIGDQMRGTARCCNCGNETTLNNLSPHEQYKMYKSMRRYKVLWRILFVFVELLSLPIALVLCYLSAKLLDTEIFAEQSYLILLAWVGVAIYIFRKFKYRIM